MNNQNLKNGDESRQLSDEGWWASVLNDELLTSDNSKATHNTSQNAQQNTNDNDWELIKDIYETDRVISVVVDNYNKGGLLVSTKGIQGFIPGSHLLDVPFNCDETERQKLFDTYLEGSLEVKIIEWDMSKERVVLSERSALAGEGKRKKLMAMLKEGDIVFGNVTNITDFGIFLDLGGVEGLIHLSELSWGRVNDPMLICKIGEKIRAKIIDISETNGRIALSKKQVLPNPWLLFAKNHEVGEIIPVIITKIMSYGAFARTVEGIEGLIHISCMDLGFNQQITDILLVNQKFDVEIQAIDSEKRKLSFTLIRS